ncbi:MAG: protein-L-isoaspartate(D-aspartate) O-methyltransferase [Solirubrobacterales bacterium]
MPPPLGRGGGDFEAKRAAMVEGQLRGRGITDERVLEAMGDVPREVFVPESQRRRAYADGALAIGQGQTISQPWIVAAICEALRLRGGERVLEVGTGSGYSAAVLSRLAGKVVSVERVGELAERARRALSEIGADNVEVLIGDGSLGLAKRGDFEAIAVHAAAPAPPQSLLAQLGPGGRLVIPIATDRVDMLSVFEPREDGLHREVIGPCRFVPLIGEEGFEP